MNKSSIVIIIVLALIAGFGVFWMVYNSTLFKLASDYSATENNSVSRNEDIGTIFLSVTDAAANMGAISAIDMTIDKVYVHSQAQGWVTVSETPQSFSLLELKEERKAELLAKAEIATDTYNQVWFHVSKVMVTESGVTKEAKLPSGDLKINGLFKVMKNTDSLAEIDVIADQSLHKTGRGEFIFASVVKFQSRSNATISVGSDNMVTASGGTVDASINVGMDANGEVKNDFRLNANTKLEINNGVINVKDTVNIQSGGTINAGGNINIGY